ncbi:hypothetical protein DVH24_001313 [Malus domestica]|uniref:Inhibitor I9 domain-containing protein n=1 Tax=Malus domestica TaxID=3750 RepID=A0A498JYW7_MALDO|nr:hypothetical protein DVH24_001313 [Malus domestica]
MENKKGAAMHVIYLLCFTFMFYISLAIAQQDQNSLQTYIPVFSKFSVESDLDKWYQSFLSETTTISNQQRIVHAYRNVVTGFAAKLTPEEVKAMENKEGFLSSHLDITVPLQTTHTTKEFPILRLNGKASASSMAQCTGNITGTPFDQNGHGTHTSSTTAGNFMKGTSVFGEGNGTTVGMAPYAHLAMYRVV